MADAPLPLSEVLREEYVRLHGELPPATVAELASAADEKTRLKAIYAAIHKLNADPATVRTALCISGGGIRSATFALGVFQRLASFGLLAKFDFLSTVSGGGYIGSWLSSFARRSPGGMADVQRGIQGVPAAQRDPRAPEIEPVSWLRSFSNYLTPKLGLLSADTWAFAGSYVRNLLLVWLMFVPFLAAMLALPRLAIALLRSPTFVREPDLAALIAGVLILLGTAVVAQTRPVAYRSSGWLTNGRFQRYVLLPYVIAAILMVVYWAAIHNGAPTRLRWPHAVVGFIVVNLVPSLWYMLRFVREQRRQRASNIRHDSTERLYTLKKFGIEVAGGVFAGGTAAGLLFAASKIFTDPLRKVTLPTLTDWEVLPPALSGAPGEFFLCFAVPVVLGILFVQSAVFVGITSWFNEEYDREWWGRAAGWVLLAALVWVVFAAITIYGPVGLYFMPKLSAAVGGGAGLVSILLGKSGATSATDGEKNEKAGKTESASSLVLGLAGPLFAIAILALISLCTSRILFSLRPECPPGSQDSRCARKITPEDLALRSAGTYQIREAVPVNGRTRHFATSQYAAADKARIAAIEHLWTVDTTTIPEGLILVFGLALGAWIVSFFVGANQFSMHSLYRNRLIRAYLGASRTDREPNAFTGFDPTDNFGMDRLRAEMFWPSTIVDVVRDGPGIAADSTLTTMEARTRDAIADAVANPTNPRTLAQARDLLAIDLNRAIGTLVLAPAGAQPQSVANRKFLETKYAGAFHPMSAHVRPMHVINTTLNLVSGDQLAWQERKAESFTVSPLHSGAFQLDAYRRTAVYGGPAGVSVGTAVAISGAAASPNMGYNSSPALSFLLTLFNVRLGWWYGNPKKDKYGNRNPANTLKTVLDEALGHTNDENDYVYLSDGAHFDNLGLYEMVLRRCGCIVVSDAGADPDFGFGDLGNVIRKIRVDLGIEIVITHMRLFPRSSKYRSTAKYCATGIIRYSAVDPGAPDGRFLYLKPAFYGKTEPKDVYNYATTYPAFPHQSTADQWFSESQFESYRQLGYFAAGEAANGKTTFDTVCALIDEAGKYIDQK
jgi:hypothetical protein